MTKRWDLVHLLEQAGFQPRNGTGHERFVHPDGRTTFVPRHREIRSTTAKGILKQAGLSDDGRLKR